MLDKDFIRCQRRLPARLAQLALGLGPAGQGVDISPGHLARYNSHRPRLLHLLLFPAPGTVLRMGVVAQAGLDTVVKDWIHCITPHNNTHSKDIITRSQFIISNIHSTPSQRSRMLSGWILLPVHLLRHPYSRNRNRSKGRYLHSHSLPLQAGVQREVVVETGTRTMIIVLVRMGGRSNRDGTGSHLGYPHIMWCDGGEKLFRSRATLLLFFISSGVIPLFHHLITRARRCLRWKGDGAALLQRINRGWIL